MPETGDVGTSCWTACFCPDFVSMDLKNLHRHLVYKTTPERRPTFLLISPVGPSPGTFGILD